MGKNAITNLLPGSKKLEHVTEELYRKNVELADTNRVLSLLRNIDDLVLSSQTNSKELAEKLVEIIFQENEFNYVQLFMKVSDHFHIKSYALSADLSPEDLSLIAKSHFKPDLYEIISDAKHIHTRDSIEDILAVSTRGRLKGITEILKLKRIYIVPLRARNNNLGYMLVGTQILSEHAENFRLDLMTRLMGLVGVSIDSAILFGELKRTNKKLKELDSAKDEFISMASHQLRTPLTTIKGYLSMVLEGDAGKLNKEQHQFIDQAFGSSQRMVYLIADLLNVSRLNTGKFVIDPVETNLAEVVQQEVDQLQRHAATRNMELTYKKPAKFPIVKLDETKTRQVIMNFTDNALYYTPAGGKVKVDIRETPTAIEFTVSDNGIGVPKELQHKLFSKFYRADNAKQARPDGTGLGLFMAKKVIIAQGGAVIFKSKIGVGSTFGFSFPKKNILVKE